MMYCPGPIDTAECLCYGGPSIAQKPLRTAKFPTNINSMTS